MRIFIANGANDVEYAEELCMHIDLASRSSAPTALQASMSDERRPSSGYQRPRDGGRGRCSGYLGRSPYLVPSSIRSPSPFRLQSPFQRDRPRTGWSAERTNRTSTLHSTDVIPRQVRLRTWTWPRRTRPWATPNCGKLRAVRACATKTWASKLPQTSRRS